MISDLFLTYSTNIRVDLIGYWFGLFSFLCILDKRFLIAGMLLGAGFITTQKVIWYLVASNVALLIYWLVYIRDLKSLRNMMVLNLGAISIIFLYIAIWSSVSSIGTVLDSVFREASIMYHLDSYVAGRKLYWRNIVTLNPFLFLIWPSTLISIFVTYSEDTQYKDRLLCILYAFTVLFLLIPYKQVFPYYMQVTIPVFFVLYSAFFSWALAIFRHAPLKVLVHPSVLWSITLLYFCLLITVVYYLDLPKAYLLTVIIPFSLTAYIVYDDVIKEKIFTICLPLISITLVFIGAIYPLTLVGMKIANMDGAYQQANVHLLHSLLADGSDYVAGIELIYNKDQPVPGMRHLGLDAIHYLYAPSLKLRPMMMASLYGDPKATITSVIDHLKQSSVKFYVNNYRMRALPPEIKNYLDSSYEHFWGSIYLYAPRIMGGATYFTLKFSGNYLIETGHHIVLNNKLYHANTLYHLEKGNYHSQSQSPFRLKLMPTDTRPLAKFNNDEWMWMIY
jgi:hypothetical protein